MQLGESWADHYAIAVRSWENNWEELAAFFDFPAEIRRAIYTTNAIEGYNRQLRKVIKTKGAFSFGRLGQQAPLFWLNRTSARNGPSLSSTGPRFSTS